jgi:hypothetical protein
MAAAASTQTSSAVANAYSEALATHARALKSLDRVSDIVSQSRLAVRASRELIDKMAASRLSRRFSIEARCERELAFSLGAPSTAWLSRHDRRMIGCVCGELDEIAAWQGNYEARTRFDAILQLFALSQEGSTLH